MYTWYASCMISAASTGNSLPMFADLVVVGELNQVPSNGLVCDLFGLVGSFRAYVFGRSPSDKGQWSDVVLLASAMLACTM